MEVALVVRRADVEGTIAAAPRVAKGDTNGRDVADVR
jgi:hypothetical protein